MIRSGLKTAGVAVLVTASMASTAMAGGIERAGYNIDQLFDTSRFAVNTTLTYVMPDRTLTNAVATYQHPSAAVRGATNAYLNSLSSTAKETPDYAVFGTSFKLGITDKLDCLLDQSQPWGAHSAPGAGWAGASSNIETEIESFGLSATCSYKFDLGKGNLRIIGGGTWQEISGFKERLVALPGAPFSVGTGVGRLDLSGEGGGFRIGAAYEIPEIALRASLMYYSEVKLDDITGTLDLSQVNGAVLPVFGSTALPEVVELKVQSGVAPGWLVFGSVKWVDWSQIQNIPFCVVGTPVCTYNGTAVPGTSVTSLDLLYQDGWTVSAGVGHKFNDAWSGALQLAWDRGTSTGLGTQTDTWTLSGGVSYTPDERFEFRFGGAVGLLTSGSSGTVTAANGNVSGNDVSYSFGDDIVTALSASAKIKF